MAQTSLKKSEIAVILRDFRPKCNCGYLVGHAGDQVQILHVGSDDGDDDGWVYAQALVARGTDGQVPPRQSEVGYQRGWIPATHLEPLLRDSAMPGSLMLSRSKIQPPVVLGRTRYEGQVMCRARRNIDDAPDPGYLKARTGDIFSVLYNGSVHTGDVQWLYARSVNSPDQHGWLHCDDVDEFSANDGFGMTPTNAFFAEAGGGTTLSVSGRPHETHGAVEIFTFGLENFDPELRERCNNHIGGGWSLKVSEEDLLKALARNCVHEVDVVIDARGFPDPDAAHDLEHIGVHFEIIERIVSHRNFETWLARAKEKWTKACVTRLVALTNDDPFVMRIATYCKSGKHRSVALAAVLKYIFKEEGWSCTDPTNLSEPCWGKYCCRGLCPECTNPPQDLNDVLDSALRLWYSIQI